MPGTVSGIKALFRRSSVNLRTVSLEIVECPPQYVSYFVEKSQRVTDGLDTFLEEGQFLAPGGLVVSV